MTLEKYATLEMLRERLANYPGPHPGEKWKLEKNLEVYCTINEVRAVQRLGLTMADLMQAGFNRGQVHHMLFGYRYSGR